LSRQLWKTKHFDYKKIFFPDPFKDIFATAFCLDIRMIANWKERAREAEEALRTYEAEQDRGEERITS
jgi:hypothetical protein